MTQKQSIEETARFAHRIWCEHMTAAGWKRGGVYDKDSRRHDALVPFDELSPEDRQYALSTVPAIVESISYELKYHRGSSRPFSAGELRRGMPVQPGVGVTISGEPGSPPVGVVEDWTVNSGTGTVNGIRVRWPSGDVLEHEAAMRELSRCDA